MQESNLFIQSLNVPLERHREGKSFVEHGDSYSNEFFPMPIPLIRTDNILNFPLPIPLIRNSNILNIPPPLLNDNDFDVIRTPLERCVQLLSTQDHILSKDSNVIEIITNESQRIAYIKKMRPGSDKQTQNVILELWNSIVPITKKKNKKDRELYTAIEEIEHLCTMEQKTINYNSEQRIIYEDFARRGSLCGESLNVPYAIGYGWYSKDLGSTAKYVNAEGIVCDITLITVKPKLAKYNLLIANDYVLIGKMYFFVSNVISNNSDNDEE
jgi:hypothetical protein